MIIKRIKRILFKIFRMSLISERFKKEPPVFESIISANPKKLFILVLAYNTPELIKLNFIALKKFIVDDFEYFALDNSNNDEESEKIKDFCMTKEINYVRLPKNPSSEPSINAGMALNWAYRNIIERFKPERFGIVDSDMFPTAQISINTYLDKSYAWGVITFREPNILRGPWKKVWYMWLGLCFFRYDWFGGREPNYLPDWGVDSGGRIKINPKTIMNIPAVYWLQDPRREEIFPEVEIHWYGTFAHFSASSFNPVALAEKSRWMENLLSSIDK